MPYMLVVSPLRSLAIKKSNEMQVCKNDNREKLDFALNNIFKINLFTSIYTLL